MWILKVWRNFKLNKNSVEIYCAIFHWVSQGSENSHTREFLLKINKYLRTCTWTKIFRKEGDSVFVCNILLKIEKKMFILSGIVIENLYFWFWDNYSLCLHMEYMSRFNCIDPINITELNLTLISPFPRGIFRFKVTEIQVDLETDQSYTFFCLCIFSNPSPLIDNLAIFPFTI